MRLEMRPDESAVLAPLLRAVCEARRRIGDRVALQGNMDPAVLYASPAAIRAEVARILDDFGDHPGHIFNLGHGITPEVDPEHAKVFIEAVVELGERK